MKRVVNERKKKTAAWLGQLIRASVCCEGGRGSIPGRTNTHGLKIPERLHVQCSKLEVGNMGKK